jgi:hypothetical protein
MYTTSERNGKIALNRHYITGILTKETPWCVIKQVGKCLRFTVPEVPESNSELDNLLKAISNNKDFSTSSKDISTSDGGHIARFINNDVDIHWKLEPLRKAYTHIQEFYDKETVKIPKKGFTWGDKTPEDPYSYDVCMLYRICLQLNIKTENVTTERQMAEFIISNNEDVDEVRSRMIMMIQTMDTDTLLKLKNNPAFNILLTPSVETTYEERKEILYPIVKTEYKSTSSESYQHYYNKLMNFNHILYKTEPRNHQEAVLLSAIIYGINLTECNDPMEEYNELKKLSLVSGKPNYIPRSDPLFKKRYITNPGYYKTNMNWVAILPCIYKPEDIAGFAIDEGWNTETGLSQTEFLSVSKLTSTFYMGIHPRIIHLYEEKFKTCIGLDNPFDISRGMLVSYGVDSSDKFDIYSIDNLSDCFINLRKFSNPSNTCEMFSKEAIYKLKSICKSKIGHLFEGNVNLLDPSLPESNEMLNQLSNETKNYSILYNSITYIERISKYMSPSATNLVSLYDKNQDVIKYYLNLIMELALYMRGWKLRKNSGRGDNDYPLVSLDTVVNVDDQHFITINTTRAIYRLENYLKDLHPILKKALVDLPLVRSFNSNGKKVFNVTTNKEEGFTFIDRLKIVKDGSSDYACIRITSNHFLSTSYFYLTEVLGCNKPFNIYNVGEIS